MSAVKTKAKKLPFKTVAEAVAAVEKSAAVPEVRNCPCEMPGDWAHQGDVYLHRVADDWPCGEEIGKGQVQVALGVGNGARHMAEGPIRAFKGVKFPDYVEEPEGLEEGQMLGPVIKATSEWTLTHPEHAHHVEPGGCYQVTYQYDPRTMRRVQD